MIQTIRLIREKKDDIWVLYVAEFLKFIGCIVSDYVLPDTPKVGIDLSGRYDAEIVLNCGLDELNQYKDYLTERERTNIRDRSYKISVTQQLGKEELLENKGESKILKDIVNQIWAIQPELEEIRYLANAYAKSNIFFYLYNEGNLKFVQEYYPVNEYERSNPIEEAYKCSFNRFASCYNMLIEFKEKHLGNASAYYEYALLYMRYKLNEMGKNISERKIFSTGRMLDLAEKIKEKEPTFARINYLAGSICKFDSSYWYDVEFYYNLVIKVFDEIDLPKKDHHFLYYQLGRFCEKKLKDIEAAYYYYQMSYDCSKEAYRSLYKLAKRKVEEKKINEAIEDINRMIAILLNGYDGDSIMPKQKIYGYKCYVFLGDIYFEQGSYDLAVSCYRYAEKLSGERCSFYRDLEKEECRCFEENFQACMPVRTLYHKIVSCASKGNERYLIDEYLKKLQ